MSPKRCSQGPPPRDRAAGSKGATPLDLDVDGQPATRTAVRRGKMKSVRLCAKPGLEEPYRMRLEYAMRRTAAPLRPTKWPDESENDRFRSEHSSGGTDRLHRVRKTSEDLAAKA